MTNVKLYYKYAERRIMQLQIFIPHTLFDRLSLNFVRNYKIVYIYCTSMLFLYSLALCNRIGVIPRTKLRDGGNTSVNVGWSTVWLHRHYVCLAKREITERYLPCYVPAVPQVLDWTES